MVRIAHIADLHVAEEDVYVRDIDVRQNFLKVLKSVCSFHPDVIVLGGDLAAVNGELGAYQWIKEQLDPISIPFLITPGNHDDNENLAKVFINKKTIQKDWDFTWKEKELMLMGLDSSKGKIENQQLHWLHKTAKSSNNPIFLFTHYPPLECGCRFMDTRWPLADKEDVFKIVMGCENIIAVFCGHYHTEKTLLKQGKQIFLTPSTAMQMSQTSTSYEVESLRPGWRLIEWSSTGLSTRVVYIDCPSQIQQS